MSIILFIATSKDGFIADETGGVDWLPGPSESSAKIGESGYAELLTRVKVIVMGRKSYDQIVGFGSWAWGTHDTYVFSSRPVEAVHSRVHSIHEDVTSFASKLQGVDVWLLGGAALVDSFAREKLIDECIITVTSTVLGAGIALKLPYEDFTLCETRDIGDGMMQMSYVRRDNLDSRCG